MRFYSIVAVAAAGVMAVPGMAQEQRFNPQIDYPGFQALTGEVAGLREQRLLSLTEFKAKARAKNVLLLDARSADAFRRGHIKGAVNLPFTDFTDESLARVIGADRDRPILIYCNNNFMNDRPPVMLKAPRLSLNIQTFINLVGYGYSNVWELRDTINFDDPKVEWVKGRKSLARNGGD